MVFCMYNKLVVCIKIYKHQLYIKGFIRCIKYNISQCIQLVTIMRDSLETKFNLQMLNDLHNNNNSNIVMAVLIRCEH